MLKFLESKEASSEAVAPKKRGRPPKNASPARSSGKSPKQTDEDSSSQPHETPGRSDSQFETISDSESPDKSTPTVPKRKRGRPPKNKELGPPQQQTQEKPRAESPIPPPTPAFDKFEMPPTPRFEPAHQMPPPSTPGQSVPSTPSYHDDLPHGSITPAAVSAPLSPQKRGRGRPKKQPMEEDPIPQVPTTTIAQTKADVSIMDIIHNVTQKLDSGKDDAPFDLAWTPLPGLTPSYTPRSTHPPYGAFTPAATPKSIYTPGAGATPNHNMPATPADLGLTPKVPLTQPEAVIAMAKAKSTPSNKASGRSVKKEDRQNRSRSSGRRRSGKSRRSRHHAEASEEQMEEPESPPCVFGKSMHSLSVVISPFKALLIVYQNFIFAEGINDLPRMDVSSESFRLDSRVRKPETTGAQNDLIKKLDAV